MLKSQRSAVQFQRVTAITESYDVNAIMHTRTHTHVHTCMHAYRHTRMHKEKVMLSNTLVPTMQLTC